MSGIRGQPQQPALEDVRVLLRFWWPLLLGFLVLYLPTYAALLDIHWEHQRQIHGPIVVVVILFLIWRQRAALVPATHGMPVRTQPLLGTVVLSLGLLLFAYGRTQASLLAEVISQIPVLAGAVLLMLGVQSLRGLWFIFLFLLFLAPLPDFIVDAAVVPMRLQVAEIAEQILYLLNYPVARSDDLLMVGQYQLVVASTCSGFYYLITLMELGLLYLYLKRYRSVWRNALLIASILPIAFSANIARVLVLVLVTYHLGDAAGQGRLHGLTGITLFVAALLLLFAFDAILGYVFTRQSEQNIRVNS